MLLQCGELFQLASLAGVKKIKMCPHSTTLCFGSGDGKSRALSINTELGAPHQREGLCLVQ
jgi:hypothetical protein